jgi:hypothetical protein
MGEAQFCAWAETLTGGWEILENVLESE